MALLPAYLDIHTEPKDANEASAVANLDVSALIVQADGILAYLDGYMDTFRFSNVNP